MKILPWGTTLADCEREARENGLQSAAGRLVVARNYGFFTWRRLEDYIDHPAGLSNFLQLACLQYFPTDSPVHRERARAMLSGDPALAQRDIWSAACVGDVATVGGLLGAEPDLVSRRGGYHDWEPPTSSCCSNTASTRSTGPTGSSRGTANWCRIRTGPLRTRRRRRDGAAGGRDAQLEPQPPAGAGSLPSSTSRSS